MGQHRVDDALDPERKRRFMRRLLVDCTALERMLEGDRFEHGSPRIGAEQELFLIGDDLRPAPVALEVLEQLDDAHTTELARFNLEFNLEPIDLDASCFERLHQQLDRRLAEVREAAHNFGAKVLLVGILPTLEKGDLGRDNMTPIARYYALDDAVSALRGGPLRCHIKGRDELAIVHDNVMLEACNTSYQFHLQVDPARFARIYNLAQVATAPVLAAAVCSPLLFGHRLWHETRIALFQQAVDTRRPERHRRPHRPRVSFGDRWLDESVLEILRDDIARFRLLLALELEGDPLAALDRGEIPDLPALRLHNGTIYRWNRPCFGVAEGRPHLRIETRALPAGPSVIDEVANSAFWLGLVAGMEHEIGDVRASMRFGAAHANFLSAARLGLGAQFEWMGRTVPAARLISEQLLPLAEQGLASLGISGDDVERYLGVIRQRVDSGQTGSRWMLDSLANMSADHKARPEALVHLTGAMVERQQSGEPVHAWPLARWRERDGWQTRYLQVGAFMTTDLLTVHPDEAVDLAAALMDWRHLRHVPVEDEAHRLLGLITHRRLLRHLIEHSGAAETAPVPAPVPARQIMITEPHTVTPTTTTREAIALMRQHRVSCLPVLEHGRLVGIVSERDFIELSSMLLDRFLEADDASTPPAG